MGSEVQQLRTSARIFQHSKCTACTAALDLPAVHFLCMHSFHTRCLGEDQADCPRCAADNREVADLRRALEGAAGAHDQFFERLGAAEDGFSVVAEHYGKGLFSRVDG